MLLQQPFFRVERVITPIVPGAVEGRRILILGDDDSPLRTLDSRWLLARAALRRAVEAVGSAAPGAGDRR